MSTAPAPGRPGGLPLMLVIVAIVSVNALSISVVLPALPSLAGATGADPGATQLVLSGYLMAIAAGQIVVGVLADHFGRRPVLLAGMALFVLGAAIPAFTDSISVIVAARVLQGLGGSAGTVVGRAIVRDLFDRDRAASVYGYVTMGLAVAPMIAPAVGGLVDEMVGWRAVFLLMAAIGVAVMLAALRFLRETGAANRRDAAAAAGLGRNIVQLLGMPAFWSHTLVTAFAAAAYFAFLGGAPFLAEAKLAMSSQALGIFLAFVSIGYFFGNTVAGLVSERLGIARMINIGNLVALVSVVGAGALYAFAGLSPWTLFVPVAFLAFGNGLSLPSAFAGSISVRPDLAGTASGVVGTLQFGGGALASAAAGALVAASPDALLLTAIMAVLVVAALLSGLWASATPPTEDDEAKTATP